MPAGFSAVCLLGFRLVAYQLPYVWLPAGFSAGFSVGLPAGFLAVCLLVDLLVALRLPADCLMVACLFACGLPASLLVFLLFDCWLV